MSNIIHQIFSDNIDEFIKAFNPSYSHMKVLNHIVSCRTPALGAAVYTCECGESIHLPHSCRDRHCPICSNINNARWAEKQLESSLPVKYFHIVFTLPDTLNGIMLHHPKESYDSLFFSASTALLKLSNNKKLLGAKPGFTAVLHTWGQTMQYHPHLHIIITAGGLAPGNSRFVDKSSKNYLFPVKVLSRLFRGIFIDTLDKKVRLNPELKSLLYRTEFFCYLKQPLSNSESVVKYLARYTNRVCISASRICHYDKEADSVTFKYKDNRDEGTEKTMTISAIEFIRRFMLHVLPKRFMKIRHYGLLNNHHKFERINLCRKLLASAAKSILSLKKSSHPLCSKCRKAFPPPKHYTRSELHFMPLLC